MAQRSAPNLDVQRGEQVNRSFSAVVFDVEHGLRRFLSMCRERAQRKDGSREIWLKTSKKSLVIQMLAKVLFVPSSCPNRLFKWFALCFGLVSIKMLTIRSGI